MKIHRLQLGFHTPFNNYKALTEHRPNCPNSEFWCIQNIIHIFPKIVNTSFLAKTYQIKNSERSAHYSRRNINQKAPVIKNVFKKKKI